MRWLNSDYVIDQNDTIATLKRTINDERAEMTAASAAWDEREDDLMGQVQQLQADGERLQQQVDDMSASWKKYKLAFDEGMMHSVHDRVWQAHH